MAAIARPGKPPVIPCSIRAANAKARSNQQNAEANEWQRDQYARQGTADCRAQRLGPNLERLIVAHNAALPQIRVSVHTGTCGPTAIEFYD
jgi:hypothetical protein